jgi:flagellar biosynthesis protein FlhF
MRIKKIQAKNFRKALALVKKELGKDAVILSSEDKKGMRPYVEVTAAIDYDMETIDNKHVAIPKQRDKNTQDSNPDLLVNQSAGLFSDGFTALKHEIKSLREYIETMRNSGFELRLPEERKKMFYLLRERSINDNFALKLVERANDIEDLEMLMYEDMNSSTPVNDQSSVTNEISFHNDKRVVMLIGPTGVGKTTTVAKLASKAIKEGKKVALISIDTYKIGAVEQIRIYSRMMGIPLDIVSNTENLRNSIRRFSDRDILLVDTTGQNPKDDEYLKGLKDIYRTGLPIETQLLLSTSSDSDFLMESYKYYGSLPIDYVAFTKTDEAVKLGSIYNLCRLYQKPVAYITTGQRVPGNIEFVDCKKLTNLILKTGSA